MWWLGKNLKHLPEATGPLVPGCMDVMLDYSKDGIMTRLYYPTDLQKDDPENAKRWCRWIPHDSYLIGIANVLMSFVFVMRAAFWWSAVQLIPVVYGAKPKTDKKLQCIVLSHGLGGHRWLYSNVCCELASRGYLVVALEHRDGSACHAYYYKSKEDAQNQRPTPIDYRIIQLGKDHWEKRNDQVKYRAKECSQALDFITSLNKGEVPHNIMQDVPTKRVVDFKLEDLVGKLDLETLTMAGHSFGGATALLTLSQRKEFKQGVLFDPWMFPIKNEELHLQIDQPLLFLNTQTFHIASNVTAMSSYLDNESSKMYTILHTTHENQTDSVLLIGYWLNWFMKKLHPVTALKINNALTLRFLSENLQSPCSIEDCQRYLEEQKGNFETGLTKPWA